MRKIAASLLIFIVAFGSGTLGTKAYYKWNIQFRLLGSGVSSSGGGGYGSFSSWESYDGQRVTKYIADFESHEAARRSLDESISTATDILEKEILYDRSHTKVVGERYVTRRETLYGRNYYEIISLDETTVYTFISPSLPHVRIFEARERKF